MAHPRRGARQIDLRLEQTTALGVTTNRDFDRLPAPPGFSKARPTTAFIGNYRDDC